MIQTEKSLLPWPPCCQCGVRQATNHQMQLCGLCRVAKAPATHLDQLAGDVTREAVASAARQLADSILTRVSELARTRRMRQASIAGARRALASRKKLKPTTKKAKARR